MSIMVDTGVFFALQDDGNLRHLDARKAMARVASGSWGRALTSDYIFDEALTLTRSRLRSYRDMMALADRILGRDGFPHVLDVLMVTGPIFREALRVLETYKEKPLSFTDATTIALVRRRRVDQVLSFDDDFDGIVPRIDPRNIDPHGG